MAVNKDEWSRDEFLNEVYEELYRRAATCMRGLPGDHTLQQMALINEVFLKLNGAGSSLWDDRTRFLATASQAKHQVLIDHARKHGRQKSTPSGERTPLDQVVIEFEEHAIELEALGAALKRLAERDPEIARAVELRSKVTGPSYIPGSTRRSSEA